MAFSKSDIAFSFAMVVALLAAASAQNKPKDFVDLHNEARAADGVGPVEWDSEVAYYSQSYAAKRRSDCQLKVSNGPYGENLFRGPAGQTWTAADAVGLWVAQKEYYHYDTNTCDPGKYCGTYTQVVWSNTTRIGCARVVCTGGAVFIICNYDPAGNLDDERPFTARP